MKLLNLALHMTIHAKLLVLGLLFLGFKDAIREGDRDRVLCVWKYLMLIWKATGHKNYSIEAFTMLTQYHLLLPKNLAAKPKWSRFINIHGKPGHLDKYANI